MNITVLCAGKLREAYLRDAAAEYEKRLSRYCKLKIVEVDDGPDMEAEAERMLKRLKASSYIITLEIEGRALNSEELAGEIERLKVSGSSDITFIIGGSEGLSGRIRALSKQSLSFSRLTFTHQMMRIILLEQIYRSFKIINKEPYHK